MKLDNVLLVVVGAVILLILVGLGIGAAMLFFSGNENPVQNGTIIKYQCSNGNIVSKINECPKVATTLLTAISGGSTVVTQAGCVCPTAVSCPACGCTTRPTTSPPTTLCVPCSIPSTCGQTRSDMICKSSVPTEVVYTPVCSSGCCMWSSTYSLKTECTGDQICLAGACVQRDNTNET